jgi:soluble lytic murein transglycosylase-like protein
MAGSRRFPVVGRMISDYRVICTCQLHRRSVATRSIDAIRSGVQKQYGSLLLSATVALAGVGLPMKAMTEDAVSSAPRKLLDVRPSVRRVDPPLSIITHRVRRQFARPGVPIPEQFVLERRKEEYFFTSIPYGRLIYSEARKNNLPPELVAAVVKTESDFRPTLLSNKNAQGLMQLIPSTGKLMGATNLMDPADNVRAGVKYLRYLTDRFEGNRTLILAAYNTGEATVRKYGGVPPYKETHDYLERVARSTRDYEQQFSMRVAQSMAEADELADALAGH